MSTPYQYRRTHTQTVGDSYVGITNLVEDQSQDHAARMARFALDAIQVTSKALKYMPVNACICTSAWMKREFVCFRTGSCRVSLD